MNSRGFTLIELMVALALIALFGTLALPLAELSVQRNREADLHRALRDLRDGLDRYKQAADDGRILLRPGDSGYPRRLRDLVDGVEDLKSPTRLPLKFLRRIPRDPLADPATPAADSWGLRSYLSPHDRPRAGDDIFDVHSLSPGIGINGIPYREW